MYLSHTEGLDNYMYSYVRQAASPALNNRYSEQALSGTSLKGPDGLWGTPSLQLTIKRITEHFPWSQAAGALRYTVAFVVPRGNFYTFYSPYLHRDNKWAKIFVIFGELSIMQS